MALVGTLYAMAVACAVPATGGAGPDIAAGLTALWDPIVIIALQVLWAVMFLYTGWSMVTGSLMSFYVHRDRI